MQKSYSPNSYKFSTFYKITVFILLLTTGISYIDIPLTINRPQNKSGQITYNFQLEVNGYLQNISLSLTNEKHDQITSTSNMKQIYKQKHMKKGHSIGSQNKNHNNIFGSIQATSLQGYSFQGWRRYFMEAFLYIQSRYYHQITVNLDQIQQKTDQDYNLTQGILSLGPKLTQNQFYNQIKKNTDFINYDIAAFYSGVGERKVRMQLGGYQDEYIKGDVKTGAFLYQYPLTIKYQSWNIAVPRILFTKSKNRKTDEFIVSSSLVSFRLSLQSQFIVFPEQMRGALQTYIQSENNECQMKEFLQCKNMSTIDLSLSEFAFQLAPNHFMNISLYDLRRSYDEQSNKMSFYIKLSQDAKDIQIGSSILKEYYMIIDMNKQNLLFSPVNRFNSEFSSIYALRFVVYFCLFTIVMAIVVAFWQAVSDPSRKNKIQYGRDGIQLITYQRPGGVLGTQDFDD